MQLNESLNLAVLSERTSPIVIAAAADLPTKRQKYLASEKFVLVNLPLYMAARVYKDYINQRELRQHPAILQMSASAELQPIIVDVNDHRIGQSSLGYIPPVIVKDGADRHLAASVAGRETIPAWVGEKAAAIILRQLPQPTKSEMAASAELPKQPNATRMDASLALYAGGTKSVGGRQVPMSQFLYVGDPNKKETWKLPTFDKSHLRNALARLNQTQMPGGAKKKVTRKLGKKARSHGIDTDLKGWGKRPALGKHGGKLPNMSFPHTKSMGTNPTMPRKLRADANSPGSGVGPDLTKETVVKADGCPGCGKTQIKQPMMGADYVKKIVTGYAAAVKNGYKPEMKAVAPPGCEDMVKGLKDANVDNPYAVAWWHHNTYGGCGGGSKKGK